MRRCGSTSLIGTTPHLYVPPGISRALRNASGSIAVSGAPSDADPHVRLDRLRGGRLLRGPLFASDIARIGPDGPGGCPPGRPQTRAFFQPAVWTRAPYRKKVAMSSTAQGPPHRLPEHPDLRHLKDQAKDLLRAGQAASLADAQFQLARRTALRAGPSSRPTSNPCKRSGGSSRPSTPRTSSGSSG